MNERMQTNVSNQEMSNQVFDKPKQQEHNKN